MHLPAFRVGSRRFASLASHGEGYGNLTLTPEHQAAFVEEAPDIFLPNPGGFGRMGHTHIRLNAASEDILTGALHTAWELRAEKYSQQQQPGRGDDRSGLKFGIPRDEQKITSSCILAEFSPVF